MDTYKNNLLLEMAELQKKLMQNRKCFFFLVKNDPPLEEIFTEEGTTWHLIYKLHHWPARINDELELSDEKHRIQRENIEQKHTDKKEDFNKQCKQLDGRTKEVLHWNDLN